MNIKDIIKKLNKKNYEIVFEKGFDSYIAENRYYILHLIFEKYKDFDDMIYKKHVEMYNTFVESDKSNLYKIMNYPSVLMELIEYNEETKIMTIKLVVNETGKRCTSYFMSAGKIKIKYDLKKRLMNEIEEFEQFQVEGIIGGKLYEELNIQWNEKISKNN
jgi:hypothetical protein